MTPEPHPSDIDLAAYAAGTLDHEQRTAIGLHVRGCAPCQAFVYTMEHVGGIVVENLPPSPLADGALAEVAAQIDRPAPSVDLPAFRAPLRRRETRRASDHLIQRRRSQGWKKVAHFGRFKTALARAALIILSVGIAFLAGEYAFFRYVDDYPASAATPGRVAIGGATTGNIERPGDADWFKVTLTSGNTYRFHLEGSDTGRGTLQFPILRILDEAGRELARDEGSVDGPGPGRTSVLTHTAVSSATYHLSAEASEEHTGTYTLSAAEYRSAETTGLGAQAPRLHP
jgi:hypothetical protein